jgi:hypothetical protein
MSITQLKAEIVEQVSKLESEAMLLEIKHLLQNLENKAQNQISLSKTNDADTLFAKAVHEYDAVLEKLAQ